MEKTIANEKVFYNDISIMRAIAVILVVIGHTFKSVDGSIDIGGFLNYFVYQYHMPLFFYISGLLMAMTSQYYSFKEKIKGIKKKFIRLMIPYFFVSFTTLIFKWILSKYAQNEISDNALFQILINEKNPNGGIWFLYTLFFVSLIAIVFDKRKIKYVSYTIIALSGITLDILNIDIVILSRTLYYFIFFSLGYFTKNLYIKMSNKNINEKCLISIAIITTAWLLIMITFTYELEFQKYINIIGKYLVIIVGIIQTYFISKVLCNSKKVFGIFNEIARYGMDIYIIGYFIQESLRIIIVSILGYNFYIYSILGFVSIILGSVFISKFIVRRIPILRLMFLGIDKNFEFKKCLKYEGGSN